MSRTIISTVGTSLLGNLRNPARNPSGLTDPYDLLKASPHPRMPAPRPTP